MSATTSQTTNGTISVPIHLKHDDAATPAAPGYQIIRRNGSVTPFDATKITVALTKAFLAVEGSTAAGSRRVHDVVAELTEEVVAALKRRMTAMGLAAKSTGRIRYAEPKLQSSPRRRQSPGGANSAWALEA